MKETWLWSFLSIHHFSLSLSFFLIVFLYFSFTLLFLFNKRFLISVSLSPCLSLSVFFLILFAVCWNTFWIFYHPISIYKLFSPLVYLYALKKIKLLQGRCISTANNTVRWLNFNMNILVKNGNLYSTHYDSITSFVINYVFII